MSSISVDQDAAPRRRKGEDRPARVRTAIAAVVIALVSLLGPILLLALTDFGIHTTNDSLTYLGAADQLAHGEGWTYPFGEIGAPVTLFPPLYPLVLAIPAALDVDPFTWVGWQNALLYAVLAGSVGWVVFRETRGRLIPAVLAPVLVQLGIPTVHAYGRIWSETLFFPLVVVTLAALARHVATRGTAPLITAAALCAAAMMTRYVGLALFVASCALLVAWPGRPIRERARSAGVFLLIASLPSALWLLRNTFASGTLTGDNELIHELRGAAVVNGLKRIMRWILPVHPPDVLHSVLFTVAVVALIVLVAALTWIVLRGASVPSMMPSAIVPVCLAYVVVHFLFIVVANAFSTRAPPFNHRILGPTFAPLVIAVVVAGDAIWRGALNRIAVRATIVAIGASLLALSVLASIETIPSIFGARAGSAAEYRAFDLTLEAQVPSGAQLFSTRPNVAWFLLRRPVSNLPRSCRGGRVLPNPTFGEELAELGNRLAEEPRAVIVFRRSKECEPFRISVLRRELLLTRVSSGPPGLVWVLSGPSDTG